METAQEQRERERQEDLQRLRGLRPIDDDFMRCIFRDNIGLAQLVLRILTGKPDLVLTRIETQADMKRLAGARSICLDAYGHDDKNRKYDLEIQRSDAGAGAHRARYHSSVLDVENLDAGQPFDALPDTYVIFITENDIFKRGCAFYPIERMNTVTNEPFQDGEHILYVNGTYRGDDDIGRLMHDFSCTSADDMYYPDLAKATRFYKETEEGKEAMCKVMEDMKNDVRKEKDITHIQKLMINLKLSVEQAMDALDIPQSDRANYMSRLQASQ